MTWIKLDDNCPDHPKLVGLTDAAFRCWVQGLCYASQYLTDGRIPTVALRKVGTSKAAGELVNAGLWEKDDEGWMVHDWLDYQGRNPSGRSPLAQRIRGAVIERDGYRCGLCGGDVDPDDIHIDHIYPRSRGGSDDLSNLQVAHSRCNVRKGARVDV